MARPGDVIEVPQLGVRVQFLATHESTGGAYTEVDVIGRPKGFIRAAHVHVGVTEHHTVLQGAMRIKLRGKMHVLAPGDELTIPPDTPHTQQPGRKRPRPCPHPADPERPQRRVLRAARASSTTTASASRSRALLPRFVTELGEAGHAATRA